jgi:hypothetical protein
MKYTNTHLLIEFPDEPAYQLWVCKNEGAGPYIELNESEKEGVYFENDSQIDEYCEQLKKLLKEGDFLR